MSEVRRRAVAVARHECVLRLLGRVESDVFFALAKSIPSSLRDNESQSSVYPSPNDPIAASPVSVPTL